ncbi:MAG TPA: hypothetical protein VHU83_16980 [Bryobacteraceae bacterium]|jgi:hypothetical protein|nr:hypothetical protein [Bryobacteraceae bacterium]
MGSYLQQYGESDERRGRVIKRIILAAIVVVVVAVGAYLFFQNFPEKQVARHFLADVNGGHFDQAYRDWGCSTEHPCKNYDYGRFMEDWGPSKKFSSPWKIASVDGCRSFVTINVQAQGSELQSLAVERDNHTLGFAPAPECQERQWRWKQFFERLFGGSSKAS